jgi:hypothetical protein
MAKTIGQLTQATTIGGSDEFVIEQTGITKRVAASVVRGGLVNADVASNAAIAFSKLAALDDANILVGNGSNVATKVAVTGDVTISNAGVTAIGSSKVLTAMVNDAAITAAKIADANVTPAKLSQPLTLATAQNTTSGTSIDFTGIPSWVKRITVMLDGVSTSSTSPVIIQLGDSGGVETSGYVGATGIAQSGTSGSGVLGAGFTTDGNATLSGSMVRYGSVVIANIASNAWVAQGCVGDTNFERVGIVGGSKTLSATLDRVRLTTVNGTDTFDAGSVNIMYEG